MAPFEIPPDARENLAAVVHYHRDRDEFPIFFRALYLLPDRNAPMQSAYDAAIDTLKTCIESATNDFRQELTEAVAHFNDDGFLSPTIRENLGRVAHSARIAHAWASSHIYATFSYIEPYLQPGIPIGSRLLATYPELRDSITPKDFLLRLGHDVTPGHAWVSYKDHEIHPHPGLRRGFHCRVHYGLLGLLWDQLSAGNDVSIGIDHFRLCPRGELGCIVELDAWFGAPFSLDKVDDKWKVGATVHGRSRATSPGERAGLLTEFRWTYSDGLKTFEVEELPHPDGESRDPTGPIICRYVHSIRDTFSKRFVHLDGAVTVYEPDAYLRRYEQATNHGLPKVWATRKVKLFRVDAPAQDEKARIPEDAWTEVIISFFRGNELVLEYFDGRSFAEIYRSRYGRDLHYVDG